MMREKHLASFDGICSGSDVYFLYVRIPMKQIRTYFDLKNLANLDPDPANQNFKNRIRFLLVKNQLDFFRYFYVDFFTKKFKLFFFNIGKSFIFKKICSHPTGTCLYNFLQLGQDRDPAKNFQIQHKRSGSATLVPCLYFYFKEQFIPSLQFRINLHCGSLFLIQCHLFKTKKNSYSKCSIKNSCKCNLKNICKLTLKTVVIVVFGPKK